MNTHTIYLSENKVSQARRERLYCLIKQIDFMLLTVARIRVELSSICSMVWRKFIGALVICYRLFRAGILGILSLLLALENYGDKQVQNFGKWLYNSTNEYFADGN